MLRNLIILKLALIFGLVSCGRMGPPRAPEEFAPSEVQYFNVSGKRNGVLLKWRPPGKAGGDSDAGAVQGYYVYRWVLDKESLAPREDIGEVSHVKDKAEYVFLDKEVVPAQAYQYAVVAYNDDSAGVYKFIARLVYRGEVTEVSLLESPNS